MHWRILNVATGAAGKEHKMARVGKWVARKSRREIQYNRKEVAPKKTQTKKGAKCNEQQQGNQKRMVWI